MIKDYRLTWSRKKKTQMYMLVEVKRKSNTEDSYMTDVDVTREEL